MAGLVLLMSCFITACCSIPLTACCPPGIGAEVGRAGGTTAADDTAVVGVATAAAWASEKGTLAGVGGPGFGLLDGVVLKNNFSSQQRSR